ncbi:MAG: radical SAM protein, partial [Chloroflexales bacterium]|nr:radical SAM protein [Chloroflexales bacterium]
MTVDNQVLAETESVCPQCLARIPAQRVARGDDVYLRKACPEHGLFETVIWRGPPALATWVQPKAPSFPAAPLTRVTRGCPFDCGLCPEHQQHSCCVLLEVTQRCDLRCPVCFADAGGHPPRDPDLATVEGWFWRLLDTGGPFNIQLSGGEPCVRDDLPEIVALGRALGFSFFQVNTNGLRLAREPEYAERLRAAGVATVFLQFDDTDDASYQALRGRPLFAQKQAAIEHCAAAGLGVVLVPTLVPGVNTDHIGAIIRFALARMPAVRGVHFQPISYFGRYPQPPGDEARITIPEVIRAIEAQTGGLLRAESFAPPGGEHAMCSFHGNFVLLPDGRLPPLTRHKAPGCCAPAPAEEGAR